MILMGRSRMSEAVSALDGLVWDQGIARIEEVGPQGMITLRGDLGSGTIKDLATGVTSVDMPGQSEANCVADRGICWMSPDELLILCSYEDVAMNLQRIQKGLGDAHALAVDVSEARATFRISGDHVREVLAKLVPVDLSTEAFKDGMFRRTRMAQVPAAFWMCNDHMVQIVCFRSHAQYVFDLLKTAAAPGSEVNLL